MGKNNFGALILGLAIFCGLAALGLLLGKAALEVKAMERTVRVKGLSEKEYPADIVIWPIRFVAADNNLQELYTTIEQDTDKIKNFLKKYKIKEGDITVNPPAVTDKTAQSYGGSNRIKYRYSAIQSVTVYSHEIKLVNLAISSLGELGKQGIVFLSEDYDSRPEYIFTRLNEVKPAMIEEATRNARDVALKFAADSKSRLGKIKRASQGQFEIFSRDKSTPYIKRVRVVSTVEYYLSD